METNNSAIKTSELVIYLADKMKDNLHYGNTLLNKALYYIDCYSYVQNGKPISSFEYIKKEFGPVPDSRQFLTLRQNLEDAGVLEKTQELFFGKMQTKYIAKRSPKTDVFNSEEITLIDKVVNTLSNSSATEISNLTHESIAWRFAELGESLPLFTFLLSEKEGYTDNDIFLATEAIAHYKQNKKGN